ncbi:thiol reductant ABC exporter subunit CydC [Gordonia amarae]|uniref:Thiol reductant ABC exporter subunit CydC n=1 Tax=Gordonia amarae TaxID=36821 RepID=A0A857MI52_9ACTN|nr:thiol reductant ABC exporter subunit CydC [Gordonia amarae]QHN24178.1 thiol reductant ABC exporter subunit CydC [Gordonia amarae]QHN33096.1 thiol reductant ABC exporter subunit CydC [Gordonia amarae]QHN41818.1 thiol reductant ABC exporter subunit CydC [Gordonia amarae]
MVRALRFLGLSRRPMAWSLLLGVGGALSALGLAALSAWLITRAWQQPPILFLSVAITAVRALGISRGVFRYLERLATHDLALRAMASARERVYRALAQGDPGFSVGLKRGALLSRTGDDIDEIGNALIRGIIPIGVGAVTGVAAVVVMALVSVWAAVVLLVALVVSGGVAPWLAARGSARTIADSAAATATSAEATTTALWHAPELVVAGRRDSVLAAATRADNEAMRAADRGFVWQAGAAAATPLAIGVSLLAACLIGIDLASGVSGSLAGVSSTSGELTPMVFGVLILLPLSAFESTAPLTEAGIQLERSRQSAARVMALVDGAAGSGAADSDVEVHAGPVTLRCSGLDWGWPGGASLGVAGGLSRDLLPGSRLVIAGPSGSGKSTLLMTVAGLLTPKSGSVLAEDDSSEVVDLRSAVRYFAEEGHIFATSVRENLLVAKGDATPAEVDAAVAAVGLSDWVSRLPDGLDTALDGGAESVSGGQRRRLLLARALLSPAPVVLLDEPVEHLDAADADTLLRRIVEPGGMFGQRTVVVVTHHLPEGISADVTIGSGSGHAVVSPDPS